MATPRRIRVTWCRWDFRRLRYVTSHPWVWQVFGTDGAERIFDTRQDALDHWATD
jgi:hypothetical protein